MTLANDSVLVTPGSGATIATHTPSGASKEYQAVVPVDEFGQIRRAAPVWRLFIPAGAVGANKVHFDLFNATGSGKTLRILGVYACPNLDTAVTGTLAVRLYLTRTTAVGTGGTGAVNEGTSLTAATFAAHNTADGNVPAQVTARAAPGGGATGGAVLSEWQYDPEETRTNGYFARAVNAADVVGPDVPPISVAENSGIRVVQGAVASVGSVGFIVVFQLV